MWKTTQAIAIALLSIIAIAACNGEPKEPMENHSITEIENQAIKDRQMLEIMYNDQWFPNELVDKVKQIIINACYQIEQQKPATAEGFYKISHAAVDEINELQDEFFAAGSELEGAAAESIGLEFLFIAETYGYEVDFEEVIGNREF
jgi:hypothetical protein